MKNKIELTFSNQIIKYLLKQKNLIKRINKDNKDNYIIIEQIKKKILEQYEKEEKHNKKIRGISNLTIFIHILTLQFSKKENINSNEISKINRKFNKLKNILLKEKDFFYNDNFIVEEEIFDIFFLWQYNTGNLNYLLKDNILNSKILKKKIWYNIINDKINKTNNFNIIYIGYKEYYYTDFSKNIRNIFNFIKKNINKIITNEIKEKIKKTNQLEILTKLENVKFFTTKNQLFSLLDHSILIEILNNLLNVYKISKENNIKIINENNINTYYNKLYNDIFLLLW